MIDESHVRFQYRGLRSLFRQDHQVPLSEFTTVQIAGKVWDSSDDPWTIAITITLMHRSNRGNNVVLATESIGLDAYDDLTSLIKLWTDAAGALSLPASDAGWVYPEWINWSEKRGLEYYDLLELIRLALLHNSQGQYPQAEFLLERARCLSEIVSGTMHPLVLADSLSSLAKVYMAQGKYSQAEPLYQRALAIYPKLEDAYAEATLRDYAVLLRKMNRKADAENMESRAQAMRGTR